MGSIGTVDKEILVEKIGTNDYSARAWHDA
jgi:hypothetical protein